MKLGLFSPKVIHRGAFRLRAGAGLGAVLVWVNALCMLPGVSFALGGPPVYERAKAATALIVAIDDIAGTVSFGSGFFLGSDGLLVTNAHVIRDHTRLLVYRQNRAVDTAPDILAVDGDADLAALRVRSRGVSALPLASEVPDVGTSVIALGYPRVIDLLKMGLALHTSAFPMTVSSLTYGRSRTAGQSTAFIQTAGLLNAGISGGPLVHAASGRVLGMVVHSVPYVGVSKNTAGTVTGTVQMRAGMSYAIPAFLIQRWLTSQKLIRADGDDTAADPGPGRPQLELPPLPNARNSFATAHLLHSIANVLNREKSLLELAVFHYEVARHQEPRAFWILRSLGRAHAALGDWKEAYNAYALALAERPQDAVLHAEIGDVLYKLHRDERAYEHYGMALQAAPCSAQAFTGMARILWRAGERSEGLEYFDRAFRCTPRSPVVVYNLGLALVQRGSQDETLQLWDGFLHRAHPTAAKEKHLVGAIRHGLVRLKASVARRENPVGGSVLVRDSGSAVARPTPTHDRADSP